MCSEKYLSALQTTTKIMATNTPANGANKWDKKELGALWKKEKQGTGEKYLTGTLNLKNLGAGFPDKDVPVIIFSNKNKKKDTHPDLRVYLSEKKGAATQQPAAAAPAPQPEPESNDFI
jgi:uncharacterized protein (DUF736 family)